MTALLMACAALAALLDWWSLWRDSRRVEYAAKPAVLVFLIAAAATIPGAPDDVRWWIVAGLVCGLVGDIALMLGRFIPGAAAFLVGHLLYIAGLSHVEHPLPAVLLGLVIVLAAFVGPGRCILRSAYARSRTLGIIVTAYQVALGAVVVLGVGSWSTLLGLGVLLFLASDLLLAWGRFVGTAPRLPISHGDRVLVHVTYHLAQALIVLSLPGLAA